MTHRLLLISTCGVSLLEKSADKDVLDWLKTSANAVEVDTARLTPILSARRDTLRAADEPTRPKMSAELNGVGAVIDRYQPKQLLHVLVHTDTAPGQSDCGPGPRRARQTDLARERGWTAYQ